jgi:photosystem II stability/assembly factor-like uncharacterized protein
VPKPECPFRARGVLLAFWAVLFLAAAPERRVSSSPAEAVGPEGGAVRALAYHPSDTATIYAAVASSYSLSTIFKSRDGGRRWTAVSLIRDNVFDLTVDPMNNRVLYALADDGVYKSTTGAEEAEGGGGASAWTRASLGKDRHGRLGKIFVHPSDPKILYASGNYIYKWDPYREAIVSFKSVDGGMTWKTQVVSKNSFYGDTIGFAMSPSQPNILYISGYYGIAPHTPNFGVFRSTNGGQSWARLPSWEPLRPAGSIVVHPKDPDRVWVTDGSYVQASRDGGRTWRQSSTTLDFGDLAVDASNPETLYCGSDFENYSSKSVDGGLSWTKGTGVYGECLKMLVIDRGPNPGRTVFFGSLGGVFRSANAGATWTDSYSGIKKTVIPALAVAPSTPSVLYAQARHLGVMKSPDAGKSWQRLGEISRCAGFMKIAVHPANAKDVVVLSGG